MNNFRLGLSCCGSQNLDDKDFENYVKAGILTMEMSFSYTRYNNLEWKNIEKRAAKFGVELWSLHLPFLPFAQLNPASLKKDVREYTFEYFSDLIKKAGDIGVKTIVIHPSAEPILDSERGEHIKSAKETFSKLAQVAESSGNVISIENIPRTCLCKNSCEMLDILSSDSRLMSCFDTNHLLEENAIDYIRAVGGRIITTHISDYDFKNERHWLPGEGKADWKGIISTLREVGYKGPWLYELEFEPAQTINRRLLTTEDFRKNYETLMKLEIPEPIGVPISELCTEWTL